MRLFSQRKWQNKFRIFRKLINFFLLLPRRSGAKKTHTESGLENPESYMNLMIKTIRKSFLKLKGERAYKKN